mmetsp:Transcript_27799/g.68670  ORF Transcript_27799/g.68670 Transcript_27799/m.68670 type:complete len:304 (+) Transcript_27799:951-1862(+)
MGGAGGALWSQDHRGSRAAQGGGGRRVGGGRGGGGRATARDCGGHAQSRRRDARTERPRLALLQPRPARQLCRQPRRPAHRRTLQGRSLTARECAGVRDAGARRADRVLRHRARLRAVGQPRLALADALQHIRPVLRAAAGAQHRATLTAVARTRARVGRACGSDVARLLARGVDLCLPQQRQGRREQRQPDGCGAAQLLRAAARAPAAAAAKGERVGGGAERRARTLRPREELPPRRERGAAGSYAARRDRTRRCGRRAVEAPTDTPRSRIGIVTLSCGYSDSCMYVQLNVYVLPQHLLVHA